MELSSLKDSFDASFVCNQLLQCIHEIYFLALQFRAETSNERAIVDLIRATCQSAIADFEAAFPVDLIGDSSNTPSPALAVTEKYEEAVEAVNGKIDSILSQFADTNVYAVGFSKFQFLFCHHSIHCSWRRQR